ncbi:MAG: hypothetical protein ABFS18_01035 [Thermodesulfobacteriota bacterium]
MRCPKCSFFSFDDLTACAKCSKDLSAIVKDLQGTCTEASRPFFLSSIVESLEPEDQTFSESHALPPTDDTDLSFDDTLTGGSPAISTEDNDTVLSDLDESIEISNDEISLELGDVMPIDLDQLDEPIDFDDNSAFDATSGLSQDSEEGITADDDIDLNFTDDLSGQSEDFDSTEILSTDALSTDAFDDDIDLDLTGDFNASDGLDLSEDFDSFDLDETSIPVTPVSDTGDLTTDTLTEGESLDLDADLLAPDTEETGAVEFDDSLLDELEVGSDGDQLSADMGDDLADFDLDETSIALEPISPPESFNADDTLSGEEALSLDDLPLEEFEFETEDEEDLLGDELLATMDTELGPDPVEPDLDQPDAEPAVADSPLEELEFETGDDELTATTADEELDLDLDQPDAEPTVADAPLEELEFETEDEEQLGDESPAATDIELDLDSVEPDLEQPDAELAVTDAPLEELSLEMEGEELIATADEELELDLDQPDAELTVADAPLEELDFDTGDEEQLGDELLATMDEELDLDFDELDSGQQDEELALDDSPSAEHESSSSPASGLDEIDVSDLLSSPDDESQTSLDDEEIDLTSLMEEDAERDDSDLDLLDEDIPEIEIIGD